MEKLIKLLNEYYEWGDWKILHWKGIGCEDHDTIGYKDKELTCEQDEIVAYLISKKFGFIKWLVENDKINYKKLLENNNFIEIRAIGWGIAYSLIMLLSIQDNPIEFLVSILK